MSTQRYCFLKMVKQFKLLKVKRELVVPGVEEIEIFHDERHNNENSPFGHQFIIVPCRSKQIVNNLLNKERRRFKALDRSVRWHKLNRKDKQLQVLSKAWLDLLPRLMSMERYKGLVDPKKIIYTSKCLGVKLFSLFIPSRDRMSDKFWTHIKNKKERNNRKYETLMRFAIKGGLKLMFNPQYTSYQKVKVVRFYTDAKALGNNRPLNASRILGRVREEVPDYIQFLDNLKITPIDKSKNKSFEVNLEELTDLVLGSTCYICGTKMQSCRNKIVKNLEGLYQKRERGKGFKHSCHFRTFSVSKSNVIDESWQFTDWEETSNLEKIQLSMKFNDT